MKKMVIAALLLLGAAAWACQKTPEVPETSEVVLDPEVEITRGVEILYSDSARIKVRISGPTMLYYGNRRDPRQEFPDGVAVDFFGPDQQPSSKLTAKYAMRFENEAYVLVRDSVVWESVNQEKLETSQLIWDERKQRVSSDRFVVVTRPDEIIYSQGFEANQDFSNIRMKAVQGRIKVEELSDELQ